MSDLDFLVGRLQYHHLDPVSSSSPHTRFLQTLLQLLPSRAIPKVFLSVCQDVHSRMSALSFAVETRQSNRPTCLISTFLSGDSNIFILDPVSSSSPHTRFLQTSLQLLPSRTLPKVFLSVCQDVHSRMSALSFAVETRQSNRPTCLISTF